MYVTDGALMSHPIFHFVLEHASLPCMHNCITALKGFFVYSLEHKGIIQCGIFNGGCASCAIKLFALVLNAG